MSLKADMFDQLAVVCQLEARGNGLAAPLEKPQALAEFSTDQWSFPHLANGLLLVLSGAAAGGAVSFPHSHCRPAFSACAADFT
jgi:hypothetical protein